MSYGADAVGRLESGKTVFVAGAVPGDVAEVRIVQEKPTYARAQLANIVQASSLRSNDWQACSNDSALVAVAPWSILSYDAQLQAKQDNVKAALVRTAHLSQDDVSRIVQPIVPCKQEWGYRNKLELAVCEDSNGRFSLGFHEQASDKVAIASTCPIGNRLVEKAPKALTGAIRYLCSQDALSLGIHRVGIRASVATGSVEVALWTNPSSFPRGFAAKMLQDAVGATSVVRVIADAGKSRNVKRVETLAGKGAWRECINDPTGRRIAYDVSAPSFFQVNTRRAETLVRLVLDALAPTLGEMSEPVVADLYSGVGTFSIPISIAGANVTAIELEGSSARDFRKNAQLNDCDIEIECDDVARALPEIGGIDAVVVDPPRAGLAEKVIGQLSEAAPSSIIYISCDPQTFARDVGRLREHGYVLQSATPVDMFPQTYHVECVGVFGMRISPSACII